MNADAAGCHMMFYSLDFSHPNMTVVSKYESGFCFKGVLVILFDWEAFSSKQIKLLRVEENKRELGRENKSIT